MPITLVVRSARGEEARLTFDGTQRIVIGRGASSDVRLPDASVSHRHASLRPQGTDLVVVDEGSTNGTFVAGARVAAQTSRIVRSGDVVCVGQIEIELCLDQSPVTRDAGAATRDLALAMVSRAMRAVGEDLSARLRVVEGRDQGAVLLLADEGRAYVVGRAPTCDLPLADADASREHAIVVRRAAGVFVRDLGARNGTWIGNAPAPSDRESLWRPAHVMRIGRTVIALQEPVIDALARIEGAPDEPVAAPETLSPAPAPGPPAAAPIAPMPAVGAARTTERARWTTADVMVMLAAVGVLALSLAGLVWLLRG